MTAGLARRCFWQTVALLVVVNVTRALGWLGPAWIPAVIVAVGVGVIATEGRARAVDLGLATRDVPAGLRYGAATIAIVLVSLLVAAVLPGARGFLHDSRADIGAGTLAYDIGVVVILVTAIPEELAFRGMLLGAGSVVWGPRRAALLSSALFGLWHITPTLHTMSDNHAVRGLSSSTGGEILVVLGAVGATFAAGLVFCWLRLRSRSLVAPVLAHVATNGLALVVAWFAEH